MSSTYTIEQFMGFGKWEAIASDIESDYKAQRFMRDLSASNPDGKYRIIKVRKAAL